MSTSLASRALRQAAIRICLISLCASLASYIANRNLVETSMRDQLRLAAEQKIKLESSPFVEGAGLEANFLREFAALYANEAERRNLALDFDKLFVRRADGSYQQREGVFEGRTLINGRAYRKMSATYAPDVVPDDDVKARFKCRDSRRSSAAGALRDEGLI